MKRLLFFGFLFPLCSFANDKFCNGAPTYPHPIGGGNVAITAHVAPTAFVGENASVCEFAIVYGTAEIRDSARVYGRAKIGDGTIVSGTAEVFDNSNLTSVPPLEIITISGSARVYGNSRLIGGVEVNNEARVFENARMIDRAKILDSGRLYGNSTLSGDVRVNGNAKIHGRAYLMGNVLASTGADICEGRYFREGTILETTICSEPGYIRYPTETLAINSSHACSVYENKFLRCWGLSSGGSLGYGRSSTVGQNIYPSRLKFVSVGEEVYQVVTGLSHTCALLENGRVKCWGSSSFGQTGGQQDEYEQIPSKRDYVDIGGVATSLFAGKNHTCALLDTGSVRCWGINESGQLGYGHTNTIGDGYDETPALAGDVDVGGTVIQLAAGNSHTCALLSSGNVRCWGGNLPLGYGNTDRIGDDESPSVAGDINVGGTVLQITVGTNHSCALLDTGKVRCWGAGSNGRLGYGNTFHVGNTNTPNDVGDISLGGTVVQIASGDNHNCALFDSGQVRCWGVGQHGSLGYGDINNIGDNELPSSIGFVKLGEPAVQIMAGGGSSCAKLESGNVICWGLNSQQQLGYGNNTTIGDNETPASAGYIKN